MALEAAKKIKDNFSSLIDFEEFTIDSDEGKKFNVSSSTNVFVDGQLLPITIWTDYSQFKQYIQDIITKDQMPNQKAVKHNGYDVIIIGGGPAGLTAGIYCARARIKAILLEKEALGGQVAMTDKIENYPGVMPISGADLVHIMESQARSYGLEIQTFKPVDSIHLNGSKKEIHSGDDVYSCEAIILATGSKTAELGLMGERELRGKGISYCAVCDANFFKDSSVAVVGGGDTAIEDAIYLSKFVRKVFVIHRRDELRATKILQETAFCNEKIEFLWSHTVKGIIGNSVLEAVDVYDLKTVRTRRLEVEGLFIAVGSRPHADFLNTIVERDELGYAKVNDKMETSVAGIFAAGDIRITPLRQVSTAVGDGAIAAISAERYLSEKRCTPNF